MYFLSQTNKFLVFTVTHPAGWTASDYVGSNQSGHFYYKNNVSDPWGNDGVHIGSFNLRNGGTTTFVIGDPNLLTGNLANNPILSNKQKYTSFCNLLSNGNLDLHFLTIVIDRPKPPEKAQTSCPCYYQTFPNGIGNKAVCPPSNMLNLNNYNHGQVTVSANAYYINSSYNLSNATSISLNYWSDTELAALSPDTCRGIRGETPLSSRMLDSQNSYSNIVYTDNTTADRWTVGNIAMPEHGCDAFCPAGLQYGAFRYWNGTAAGRECGCVPAANYAHKGGINHYWSSLWSAQTNPVVRNAKITTTNGAFGAVLSSTYYTTSTVYDSIYGGTNFNSNGSATGIYQCPVTTGQVLTNGTTTIQNIMSPRYMLEFTPRCNRGARTNTLDPYYPSTAGRYGGYGFYMKFTWDAFCYPCSL